MTQRKTNQSWTMMLKTISPRSQFLGTYDNGDIQVTVTNSEISLEEEVHLASQKQQPEPAAPVEESTKKLKAAVKMKPTKKPFKRVPKNKLSKSRNKRDKSKAGERNKKGRWTSPSYIHGFILSYLQVK